jgi:hypothetical protein
MTLDPLMKRAFAGDKEAWKQLQAEADARVDEARTALVKAQENEARVKAEGEAIMAEVEAANARWDALFGPDAYQEAAEIQKRRSAFHVVEDEEE